MRGEMFQKKILSNQSANSKLYDCRICVCRKIHICQLPTQAEVGQATNMHHQLIHTKEKPHQCNICMNTFALVSTLNTHKLLHTEEIFPV